MLDTRLKRPASCADAIDREAMTVAGARERILSLITPVGDTETLVLTQCLNRVLAQDVIARLDVPGHTNSAMDGYAISGDDLPVAEQRIYRVIGSAFAGSPFNGQCAAGECVRIMTGAAMPPGADTVIMQEQVERLGETQVRISPGHTRLQNVRMAGEDIRKGSTVLATGHTVQAADLGVIASIGIGEIDVYRKPRVAFFSTGDELRSIGDTLGHGEIYDSNRYSLHGMLQQLGVDIIDMGVVRDRLDAIHEAFSTAADQADLVITTGGVSVGEADFVKATVEAMGEIHLWKVAMKPGRPVAFGRVGDATFFGLPGNPVSVMTTFYLFALPAIQYLSGQRDYTPLTFDVACSCDLKKRPGRFECQRGILSHGPDGRLIVCTTGKQGSGILTSMSRANCLILLDEKCAGIKAGDTVTVQPFGVYL